MKLGGILIQDGVKLFDKLPPDLLTYEPSSQAGITSSLLYSGAEADDAMPDNVSVLLREGELCRSTSQRSFPDLRSLDFDLDWPRPLFLEQNGRALQQKQSRHSPHHCDRQASQYKPDLINSP
jgi:hypothetical protein